MWDLPRPGLKPVSPALAGRFLTTAPLGKSPLHFFFFFFLKNFTYLFIYPFIFGCVGSSFLCEGFLQLQQAGATLHCDARASLCWVFISVRGLSPVAASRGHSSLRCAGLSPSRPLLRSTGSRRAGSVVVVHGLSCSAACGIFPDQRSNPCPLHWQADSQPLRHQGSPPSFLIFTNFSPAILFRQHLNM